MKQTLKNIIGIGAITLFFYILFSVLNFAQAGGLLANTPVEPLEEPTPQYDSRRMVQQTIPVFCGDTSFMFETRSRTRWRKFNLHIGLWYELDIF